MKDVVKRSSSRGRGGSSSSVECVLLLPPGTCLPGLYRGRALIELETPPSTLQLQTQRSLSSFFFLLWCFLFLDEEGSDHSSILSNADDINKHFLTSKRKCQDFWTTWYRMPKRHWIPPSLRDERLEEDNRSGVASPVLCTRLNLQSQGH